MGATGEAAAGVPGSAKPARRQTVRDSVTAQIRTALLVGEIVPGQQVTLRGLAESLGVSPMPVREAVHRLAAENALEIRPNGGLHIPDMTPERLIEIARFRIRLEPELAALALPTIDKALLSELIEVDRKLDGTIEAGDVEGYMRFNHQFHFRLYEASGSKVILPLVESVWLQFGPYMRIVGGRVGTTSFVDRHRQAIEAIEARNAKALFDAIRDDILDGMGMLAQSLFGQDDLYKMLNPFPPDGQH